MLGHIVKIDFRYSVIDVELSLLFKTCWMWVEKIKCMLQRVYYYHTAWLTCSLPQKKINCFMKSAVLLK